jgi:hypothetical protein
MMASTPSDVFRPKRLDGWEGRYATWLKALFNTPFEWSINDCPTSTFNLRRDMTGMDAAVAWRGTYRCGFGGLRMMRKLGWANYAEMGTAILGPALDNPLFAQRGDICLGQNLTGFGVCIGGQVVGLTPDRVVMSPLRVCQMAWRV